MRMDEKVAGKIAEHCTQHALAFACKVSRQFVNHWFTGKRPVPAEYCRIIEEMTGGDVRAEQIRPDLDWFRHKNGLYVRY